MKLSSLELQQLHLSSMVSTTDQVEDFVQKKIDEMVLTNSDYLSKSDGGEISANVSITGDISGKNNINVGDNNKIYGVYSTAFGQNCLVGCKGFKITDIDKANLLISCDTQETTIPQEAINTDITFITTGSSKTIKLLSCNKNDNTTQLSVSEWDPIVERYLDTDVYVTLLAYPDVGNGVVAHWAHAEGYESRVIGSLGHAEGYGTTAAKYGHAEGNHTYASWAAHAEGQGTEATNVVSHAEGRWTKANGYMSHSEGWGTIADGHGSHASGIKTHALESDCASYVWQGLGSHPDYKYSTSSIFGNVATYKSHGPGTFNINPADGIDGFYVGENKLSYYFNKNDYLFNLNTKMTLIELSISNNFDDIKNDTVLSVTNDFYFTSIDLDDNSTFGVVDWGDGEITYITDAHTEMLVHTYILPGMYTITLSDNFKSIGLSKSINTTTLDSTLEQSKSLDKIISFKSNTPKLDVLIGDGRTQKTYPNMKEFIFQGTVINDIRTFNYQQNLTHIDIPNVKIIPELFLRNNNGFKHIHLANAVELKTSAFYENTVLKYARFDNLQKITSTVFTVCDDLEILDFHNCSNKIVLSNANSFLNKDYTKPTSDKVKIFLNKDNEEYFRNDSNWKTVLDIYGNDRIIFR